MNASQWFWIHPAGCAPVAASNAGAWVALPLHPKAIPPSTTAMQVTTICVALFMAFPFNARSRPYWWHARHRSLFALPWH